MGLESGLGWGFWSRGPAIALIAHNTQWRGVDKAATGDNCGRSPVGSHIKGVVRGGVFTKRGLLRED